MRDLAPSVSGPVYSLQRIHGGPLESGAGVFSNAYFPVWFLLMPDLVVCWRRIGFKVPLPSTTKGHGAWQVTSLLWALASPLCIVGSVMVIHPVWGCSAI